MCTCISNFRNFFDPPCHQNFNQPFSFLLCSHLTLVSPLKKVSFTPRDLFLFSKWSLICLCHGLLVGWFGIIIILIKCLGLLFGSVFFNRTMTEATYMSRRAKNRNGRNYLEIGEWRSSEPFPAVRIPPFLSKADFCSSIKTCSIPIQP